LARRRIFIPQLIPDHRIIRAECCALFENLAGLKMAPCFRETPGGLL
jgi:hypothetical protein